MASTATSRLRLQKQATYDNPNSWGVELNQGALDMADEAFAVKEITVNGNVTLDVQNYIDDEARALVLILSGTGGFEVTAPAVDKPYLVLNDCAADVTMKPSGGTAATIRAGTGVWYATNAAGTVARVNDPTLDKIKAAAGSVGLNGQKITNLADPTNAQDAATKNYIDTLAASGDLATVAAIAAEIVTVAEIEDGTVATDAVTDVAAIAAQVVLVASVDDAVAQLADMYVGASATAPTTRLDGSPLEAGDFYLNTTGTPTVNIYDGSSWIPIAAVTIASQAAAEAGLNNTDVMTPLRTQQFHSAASGSETITATGSFAKKPNATWYYVELWAAGGSGGIAPLNSGAGGGGGGEYIDAIFHESDLDASTTVTIGAGGAAISATGNGNNGGNSTFGTLLTARGGKAGLQAAAGGASGSGKPSGGAGWADGGGGGGASAGGSTTKGGAGGGGSGNTTQVAGVSGRGGNGGAGGATGTAGTAPGGGGGAGNATTSGAGARGECRVYWW